MFYVAFVKYISSHRHYRGVYNGTIIPTVVDVLDRLLFFWSNYFTENRSLSYSLKKHRERIGRNAGLTAEVTRRNRSIIRTTAGCRMTIFFK